MAVGKFYDAVVLINGTGSPPTGGTALPHVRSVTLNLGAAMLDITEMGNLSKVNLAGLLEWSVDVECVQDYAAANVDALLFPLLGAASFNIQCRASSATKATTNPEYWGPVVLESYPPISGAVGDAMTVKATFRCAGNIARAVT